MTLHTVRSPDHENMPLRAVYSRELNTIRKLFKVSQIHHFSVLIPAELLPTEQSVLEGPARPLGSRVVIDEDCDIIEMLRLHLGPGDAPSVSFFTSRFMECLSHPSLIGIIVGFARFPSMAVALECRLPNPRWVQTILDVPKHYRRQLELQRIKEREECKEVSVVCSTAPVGTDGVTAPPDEGSLHSSLVASPEVSLWDSAATGHNEPFLFTALESPEVSSIDGTHCFDGRQSISSARHLHSKGDVLPPSGDALSAPTADGQDAGQLVNAGTEHHNDPYPVELVTVDGCFTQSRYKRYLQPVLRLRSHHVAKVRPHLERRVAEAAVPEDSEHYIQQAAIAAARESRERKKNDTAPRKKSVANNAKRVQSNVMTRSAAKRAINTFVSHNIDEDEEELEITKIILPASQSSDGSFLPRRVIRKVFVID